MLIKLLHRIYSINIFRTIASLQVFYSDENESNKIANGMQRIFKEFKLHSRGVLTEWSACSRCGSKGGETRRKIKCIVSVIIFNSHIFYDCYSIIHGCCSMQRD